MDGWFAIAQNLMPSIADWPIFAQALAAVLMLAVGTVGGLGSIALLLYALIHLSKMPGISYVVGAFGFLTVCIIGWSVWVFLPMLLAPVSSNLASSPHYVESFGVFFSVFLLFALLGKDELDALDYWDEGSVSTLGKLFEVSLLLLPAGVPLWLRIIRFRRIKKAKDNYKRMLAAIASDS